MNKKSENNRIKSGDEFRDYLLRNPHLQYIVRILQLTGPFGRSSVQQVSKNNGMHDSVLLLLLEACVSNDFPAGETISAYRLLQLGEWVRELTGQLEDELGQYQSANHNTGQEELFKTIREQLHAHKEELQTNLLPHIQIIYELYYSPEYTSGKNDLFSYSVEFFPKNNLPMGSMEAVEDVLETRFGWSELELFHRMTLLMQALERLENRLIRPVVLQMEEAIVVTFQKRNARKPRLAFLPFPPKEIPSELLSRREQEVLSLVASGFLNKEIAEQLGISLTTIITHRKNIVRKLGINTLAGLTVYAYTHGYLNDSETFADEHTPD
jgi:DNA-binding CsgD family transcriptional regulator